jgi:hypothetical protein
VIHTWSCQYQIMESVGVSACRFHTCKNLKTWTTTELKRINLLSISFTVRIPVELLHSAHLCGAAALCAFLWSCWTLRFLLGLLNPALPCGVAAPCASLWGCCNLHFPVGMLHPELPCEAAEPYASLWGCCTLHIIVGLYCKGRPRRCEY